MTTTLRNIPQLPRPADFIGKDGKFSLVGYSYLNELEKAVSDIRGLSSTVEGTVEANAEAIADLQGRSSGKLLQQTAPSSLGALSAVTSAATPVNPIASVTITPLSLDSKIILHGAIIHSRSTNGGNSQGFLFGIVSGAGALSIFGGDWNESRVLCTPFHFSVDTPAWLGFLGLDPTVIAPMTFDLWGVDISESYRINFNSFMYAQEIAN